MNNSIVCLKIWYAFQCVAAESIGNQSTIIFYLISRVPITSGLFQVCFQCMISICNPTNQKLRSRLLFTEATRNDFLSSLTWAVIWTAGFKTVLDFTLNQVYGSIWCRSQKCANNCLVSSTNAVSPTTLIIFAFQ